MNGTPDILRSYDVDQHRGFLPSPDPLTLLSDQFADWENTATDLTYYINAGVIRQKLDELTLIPDPKFATNAERERAMMLLSFFAHAYVHSGPEPSEYIPACIAVPWVKVASELGRSPILSHRSIVLTNWRRLAKDKPIQLNNLAALCQFHGGLDESWFYLVTVEVERVGAKAIPLVLEAMTYAGEEKLSEAAHYLRQANPHIAALTVTLRKMYDQCDPYIFYTRIRPFLASFDNIEYKGTGLKPKSHHGGSAAQSSLLQFFDAAFGIDYNNRETLEYLRLMRSHMPMKHADFLRYIENFSVLKQAAANSRELNIAYKESIQHLVEFRNEHLKIVALYIMKQAKDAQRTAVGTGGTNPMNFLKSIRNQNSELL